MPDYTLPLLNGPLTVSAYGPRNAIGWCSDWCRIHELKDAGYATTEHGGPGMYGHVDYLLMRGLEPDVAPETVRLFQPAPNVMPGQLDWQEIVDTTR